MMQSIGGIADLFSFFLLVYNRIGRKKKNTPILQYPSANAIISSNSCISCLATCTLQLKYNESRFPPHIFCLFIPGITIDDRIAFQMVSTTH